MSDKLKILYAEDDKEVADSIARTISLCSDIESIDIAGNGEEALKYFNQKGDYDIVISDIQMPKLNGLDAIKEIKSKNPELFTIITTAFNEKEYLYDSIESGVDKYLLKPLDLNKLISLINTYYEQKKIKEDYTHQKEILLVESKAATLGHMMDAVAHQWKQPLGVISMLNSTIQFQIENKMLDIAKLKEFTFDISNAIEHMSTTLDEFRSFIKPDKQKTEFSIKNSLEKVQDIMKYDLSSKKIKMDFDFSSDFLINGYENQFIHIILNFVSNSIDAFDEKSDIEKKEIKITLKDTPYVNQIIYEDNAGGIDKSDLENIFKIGFTTKESLNGTGVGLYLCEQIASVHNAKIEVENISGGARFTINIMKA